MKKVIFYITVAVLATGCRKYVEIDQIGNRTLTYTSDYRALMDNTSEMESVFGYQIYSCDDTRVLDANKQVQMTDIYYNAYQWTSQYWADTQSDADWDKMFKTIYDANLTLEGVLTSEKGTDADKKQIYAEALVHRAFTYWVLVNTYAKQYDSTTAGSDLGVPMVVSTDLFASLKRGSVQAAYDLILNDLLAAVDALPDLPDYNTRPSKAGAYAVLARVYLSVRQFDKARSYAEKALALQNGLLDLRNYQTSTASFPQRLKDPEVIFSKVSNGYYQGIQLDTALLTLLGTSDLRYKLFVRPGSNFYPSFTGYGYWRYTYTREYSKMYQGPNVPEMMLIVAEAAARANDATTAVSMLNAIREKRFAAADYVALNAATGAEAMQLVIAERRREFFGTGLRWFDQKRLNKDVAYEVTVSRTFKGVTTTLLPNSNRYVFPIANKYILLNPEIQQNPE
ncbi:RagB/SusD family nutrient uptake outer membrane protein [Chitinophaga sp.]|uniref:RagB/SusD family nutrient uptake outer membrane protein n=1 Tax=Chitinophaga sp. TaxID=1869181 RepID=UPI0031DF6591